MNPKTKNFLFFFIGAFAAMLLMYFFSSGKTGNKTQNYSTADTSAISYQNRENTSGSSSSDIKSLTEENRVIRYVKTNRKLPEYYLTKNEAKKRGWTPSERNLCEVLPGHAIGGDHFGNRERKLPRGQYFEADVNYSCGNRSADRIVFSRKGEVWLSNDHYRTFEKK